MPASRSLSVTAFSAATCAGKTERLKYTASRLSFLQTEINACAVGPGRVRRPEPRSVREALSSASSGAAGESSEAPAATGTRHAEGTEVARVAASRARLSWTRRSVWNQRRMREGAFAGDGAEGGGEEREERRVGEASGRWETDGAMGRAVREVWEEVWVRGNEAMAAEREVGTKAKCGAIANVM